MDMTEYMDRTVCLGEAIQKHVAFYYTIIS